MTDQNKESEALLPCPFCGKEMEIVDVGRDWYDIRAIPEHEPACMIGEALFRVPQLDEQLLALIEDWNQRSQSSAPAWIECSKQMPEDWTPVLWFIPGAMHELQRGCRFHRADGGLSITMGATTMNIEYANALPTYWLPLESLRALLPEAK